MITLKDVSKSYTEGAPALSDINIQIDEGEFVFVVGDSGSGKSTLIKLLLKELEPTSGTIVINDKILSQIPRRQIPRFRRNVGCVFQDFRLLKDRNVYENVAFAQRVISAPNRAIKEKVPKMLSLVGLAAKYKSKPNQLSGGEQQRVAIARALINEPKILLADEPTGNLDSNNAWEIMKLLDEINKRGTTVLVFLQGFFQLGPVLLRHPALQIEGLAGIQQPSPGFLSVTLHLGQVSQLLKLGPEVSHGGQFLLQLGQLFGQLLQLPVQPDRVFCRRPRPIPQIGTGPAQSLQRL